MATKKEEGEQVKGNEQDGFVEYPQEQPEEEVSEQEQPEGEGQEPQEPEEPEKEPAFKLVDLPEQKEEQGEQPEQPEYVTIVHRGQVHQVTKDKAVELAQKGFDYDHKVGPHGKIAQMLDSNPQFAKDVQGLWDQYNSGKPPQKPSGETEIDLPEVKPLEDFDNEAEWFRANMTEFAKALRTVTGNQGGPEQESPFKPTEQDTPQVDQGQQEALQVQQMLVSRDPQHAHQIIPKMKQYADRLSHADYVAVNNDITRLLQFYEFVKEQELSKGSQPATPAAPDKPKPSFRVKSGGGQMPRQEDDPNFAWNMKKDDFENMMAKAKGF
jgi:hypothetical protein